jgi:hypothetical protein
MGVFSEALTLGVIIIIDLAAFPVIMTLDTEMVITHTGQLRLSVTGFKQALSEGYTRRNATAIHL